MSQGHDSDYCESYEADTHAGISNEYEEDVGLLRHYPQPLSRAAVSPGKSRWIDDRLSESNLHLDEERNGVNTPLYHRRDVNKQQSMESAYPPQPPSPTPSQPVQSISPQLPQLTASARLELFRTLVGMHPIDDTTLSTPRLSDNTISFQAPTLPQSINLKHLFRRHRHETITLPEHINTSTHLRQATNLGVYSRILRAENNAQLSYRFYATLVNCLYLLQVVLSAAITGISAYSSSSKSPTSISITIMGALSAATAGILAYLKARSLPTRKLLYKNQLRRVREYAEWRERQFAIDAKMGAVGYATEETKATTEVFNAAFYPEAAGRGTYLIDPHREAEIVSQMYLAARQAEQANSPEVWAAVPGGSGVGASTTTRMRMSNSHSFSNPYVLAGGERDHLSGATGVYVNGYIDPRTHSPAGPATRLERPRMQRIKSNSWLQAPTAHLPTFTMQPATQSGAPPPPPITPLNVPPSIPHLAAAPAASPPTNRSNIPLTSASTTFTSLPKITQQPNTERQQPLAQFTTPTLCTTITNLPVPQSVSDSSPQNAAHQTRALSTPGLSALVGNQVQEGTRSRLPPQPRLLPPGSQSQSQP